MLKLFFCSDIAEVLVQNGLATVVRYRQDEENRASHYDALLTAEQKAIENKVGMHSKDDPPKHRVSDCTGVNISSFYIRSLKIKKFLTRKCV